MKHGDDIRAEVLRRWIKGDTVTGIAHHVHLTVGQASGIITMLQDKGLAGKRQLPPAEKFGEHLRKQRLEAEKKRLVHRGGLRGCDEPKTGA